MKATDFSLGVLSGFLLSKVMGGKVLASSKNVDPLLDAIATKVLKIEIKTGPDRIFPTELHFAYGFLAGGYAPNNTWLIGIPTPYAGDKPFTGVLNLHYSTDQLRINLLVSKVGEPEFQISIPGRTFVIPMTEYPLGSERTYVAGMDWSAPVTTWQEWVEAES